MNTKIEELTWQEKLGQMFLIGANNKYIDQVLKEMIINYKIGGIILYRKNYDSYQDMLKFINDLKELNRNHNKIPLLIAIDQEGGRCNRMPKEFENLLSPTSITKKKDLELVERASRITARMLKQSGVNLNFAPVLDVKRFEDSHPIGNRCYGETVEEVCQYGITAMKEMKEEKILAVVKHFPGHGATMTDSHMFLPIIKKKIDFLEQNDIIPFKQAMQEGADAIMVGHLMVKELSNIYPASLSKKCVTDYIRNQLGYQGLILTDDLKMKAIQLIYGSTHATKLAFYAGNDIIMNRLNYGSITKTMRSILKQSKKNSKIENRINDSVTRILEMKIKYNITDAKVTGCDIEEINHEITDINSIAKSNIM